MTWTPTFPAEAPVLVAVRRSNGDTLAIGLGPALLYPNDDGVDLRDDLTVLSYVSASGDPPYYVSVGNQPFEGGLAFFYLGSDSEFDGSAALDMALARQVLAAFCTGRGPSRHYRLGRGVVPSPRGANHGECHRYEHSMATLRGGEPTSIKRQDFVDTILAGAPL